MGTPHQPYLLMQQKYTERGFTRVTAQRAEIAYYLDMVIYPTSPDREPENGHNGWALCKTQTGANPNHTFRYVVAIWRSRYGNAVHFYLNTDDAEQATSEYLFNQVIYKCDTSRDAPMGRGGRKNIGDNLMSGPVNISIQEWQKKSQQCEIYERMVPLTEGYDAGGAYWGIGPRLYVRYSADLNHIEFYRQQYHAVTCNQTGRTMATGLNSRSIKSLVAAMKEYFSIDTDRDTLALPMWPFVGYILANDFTIEISESPFKSDDDHEC